MSRLAGWKPPLAYFFLLALTTRAHVASWNDSARMATIDSLVERHTFAIDASDFVGTSDKILINGHFYSNKQPVMEVAGAAVLLPLHEVLGVELHHDAPGVAYYLLTLLLVGGPSALAAALLDRWFRRRGFTRLDRLVAVAGFAVATLVWPYSTVFNNHTVGGALLLLGVLMLGPARSWTNRRVLCAGLALGLSATFDLPPAALFVVVFLAYVRLQRGAGAAGSFVAGLIPALVIQLVLQLMISGDLLPTNFHREYWNFPGSPWVGSPISGEFHLRSFAEGLTYAFHSLLGSRGFLSYSPFLLWGVAGLVTAAWSSPSAERNHALATLVAVVMTMVYLVLFATQYGGLAYGERYFVGLSGVLACFIPKGCWSEAPRWRRGLFALTLVVSIAIAALGVAANPWRAETPVVAARVVQRAGIRSTLRHLGVFDLYVPRRGAVSAPAKRKSQ